MWGSSSWAALSCMRFSWNDGWVVVVFEDTNLLHLTSLKVYSYFSSIGYSIICWVFLGCSLIYIDYSLMLGSSLISSRSLISLCSGRSEAI